jgi:Tfp pilus assembly protein PilF
MNRKGFLQMGKAFGRLALITVTQLCMMFILFGCAAQTHNAFLSGKGKSMPDRNIFSSLQEGNPKEARELLASALRADPRNGYLHLLNGLSYQLEETSPQTLELAKVGYDAAVKFSPGYFWSHYFAGSIALESRNYPEAAEQFSLAILDDPERPFAFVGLAVSAYYAGDLAVAYAAADRAITLAPRDPLVLRTAAYIAAACGEKQYLNDILRMAKIVPAAADDLETHKMRLTQLLRNAALEEKQAGSEIQQPQEPSVETPLAPVLEDPKQVFVEVTLLLNQDANAVNTGINLLDGLTLQFGLENLTTDQRSKVTTSGVASPTDSFNRVFTTALRVPEITYSLNLFNKKNDYYQVIARPSLVASLGEPSQFFIGRTVTVGVSGVNLGSLVPVDVGTSVQVTPIEIKNDRSKFRVEVTRSFFAQETGGTFSQTLTTFKQTVSGTVEVEFSKTLILSGLYEGVHVGGSSKTPGLGDVPGVDIFFNARTQTERRDAALVLVTPRLPGFIGTDSRLFRDGSLLKLLSLWNDVIDPASSMDAIVGKLGGKLKTYFKAKAGDLRLPSVANSETIRLVVNETMAQMQ